MGQQERGNRMYSGYQKKEVSWNSKYDRTYEMVDLNALEQVGTNRAGTHYIYTCPFCEEKRGGGFWSNNKLFYDHEKQTGICYQCNTVIYPTPDPSICETEVELRSAINMFTGPPDDSLEYRRLSSIHMDFENLDETLLNYLSKRNPFLASLKDVLGLVGWYGTRKGVITPFIDRGNVVKFQVRFVGELEHSAKYYTSPGPKVLYSPYHNFVDYTLYTEPTVTLCEGTYDAIALAVMGYPNPLAVLGSSITSLQMYQLRRLVPEYCYIAMDSADLGWGLYRQLRGTVKSISDVIVKNFNGLDPEEYLNETYESKKKDYAENVQTWLKGELQVAK